MAAINNDKKIYVIVHGNRQNYDKVKSMLLEKKLNEEKISMASLEKAGEIGAINVNIRSFNFLSYSTISERVPRFPNTLRNSLLPRTVIFKLSNNKK